MELFVSAGSATVHIEDYGTPNNCDKTIILLHGYLETMYIWSQFADLLKDSYRVITMDMPGHGISSTAPQGAPNTMDYCAEVVKGVLDKCKVSKAVIAGHSMGGYVALAFAKNYPEYVDSVILLNSHPYPDDSERIKDHIREISIINSGKLESIASLSIPRMFYIENLRRVDDKVCETVELCEMHDPQGIVACIKGMEQRPDMREWMKDAQNTMRFLIITGDHDIIMPLDEVERMRSNYQNVRIEILQNTGHNTFIEAETQTLEIVKDFIG